MATAPSPQAPVEIVPRRAGIAGNLTGIAQNRLLGLAEDGKSELLKSLDGLFVLVEELAGRVEQVGGGPFAGYARQAVGLIGEIKDGLADKPVEELIEDGRTLVRESPGLAIGIAVAAGFLVARIVKAGR